MPRTDAIGFELPDDSRDTACERWEQRRQAINVALFSCGFLHLVTLHDIAIVHDKQDMLNCAQHYLQTRPAMPVAMHVAASGMMTAQLDNRKIRIATGFRNRNHEPRNLESTSEEVAMWMQVKKCSCGIIVLLFSAVVMISNSFAEATVSRVLIRPDASSSYYVITRPDPRLCPSPLCGGYFVKEVNKPKTRCADGTWRQDCHAAELDASALGWSDDEFARFNEQFGQRHALVRGKLRRMERGSIKADVLVIEEGWLGQALSNTIGTFYGVKASGIVCITFPCPSIHERRLNFRTERLIAEVDLAASGAGKEQVEAGYNALSEPAGILAVGEHHVIAGPAGRGLKLVTSEFYLPLVAKNLPVGQVCGGIQGLACREGQFCDIDTPNACGGADLSGVCRVPPQACALIYAPVCGCDGITYGNDCERQAAKMQLDHPGECRKP